MRAITNCLWIFYTFSFPPSSYFCISNTNVLLLKLVHICLCCKLDQQATASFGFKKDGGQTITNYCSGISKREKQKFDHFSLKSSRGTEGVSENMTICKDTRCIAICIAIQLFHIAIRFLAYRCTPSSQYSKEPSQSDFF